MKRIKKIILAFAAVFCLLTGVVTMGLHDTKTGYAAEIVSGVSRVSARGVWHRPDDTGNEKNVKGVSDFLDKLQRAGINLVFLETFYHGMTMYRSRFVPYYTKFQSYDYGEYPDYLTCFLEEAKKRDIEVHAWVEDFYIGIEENYFTKNLPEWILVTDKDSTRNTEGGGFIFLDPANEEVQKYLINFYDELLTKFPDIKGLNLDYIRYPVSEQNDDTGYTKTAISAFCKERGISGNFSASEFASYVNKNGLYKAWVDFRAGHVTEFVKRVFETVRKNHEGRLVSTAIFPEPENAYNTKKQDFLTWINRGYIDIVTPMAYYNNPAQLKNALNLMGKGCEKCFCYAGLAATYHNLSDAEVLKQLNVAEETGMDGFVFFGAKSLVSNPSYVELLNGQFSGVSSVTPHTEVKKLYRAIVTPLTDYLKTRGEDAEKVNALENALTPLYNCNEYDANSLSEGIKALRLTVKYNLNEYVSPTNITATKKCLEDLLRFTSIKLERLKVTRDDVKPDPSDSGSVSGSESNAGCSKGCSGVDLSALCLAFVALSATIVLKKR